MRIVSKKIHNKEGFLVLIPTEEEDFWHIYNLI